jgi:hypothetical protein
VPSVAFATTTAPFVTNIPSGSGGYEGQVADSASGRGLYGVEITFVSADGGFRQVVTSGENGVYRLALPIGGYHVTATYQGYEPYSTGSGVFIVPDSNYQHGDIVMVAQAAASSHVFTASDQRDNVTPDVRQLEVRYDENTVRVTLEFSKPEDVEATGNGDFVYLYGSQAQAIMFDKDTFQLRLEPASSSVFDTLQYEGTVDHPTSTSTVFEFPVSLMSDIGHKEVWAYSMTSHDQIPDDTRLLTQ